MRDTEIKRLMEKKKETDGKKKKETDGCTDRQGKD